MAAASSSCSSGGYVPRELPMDGGLGEIMEQMRRSLEIRNRQYMKRLYRNSFVGSEAVSWLVHHGFAATRADAVALGRRMAQQKYLSHVTEGHHFKDAYLFYRFSADDKPLHTSNAGNGGEDCEDPVHGAVGCNGCRWSFAPHTAHNSLVLDLALAQELEATSIGTDRTAKRAAIDQLRQRVRQEGQPTAPGWTEVRRSQVNGTSVQVFRRRLRGEFQTTKTVGIVRVAPRDFVRSLLDRSTRGQWESFFRDSVTVQALQGGNSFLWGDDEDEVEEASGGAPSPSSSSVDGADKCQAEEGARQEAKGEETQQPPPPPCAASSAAPLPPGSPQRFGSAGNTEPQSDLQIPRTGDPQWQEWYTIAVQSGCPDGMSLARLDDPSLRGAVAHLRESMLASDVDQCMICDTQFAAATERRNCPCCAIFVCAVCCSKRIFEVSSRTVTRVCIHCFQESSRIWHPPTMTLPAQVVAETNGGGVSVGDVAEHLHDTAVSEAQDGRRQGEVTNAIATGAEVDRGSEILDLGEAAQAYSLVDTSHSSVPHDSAAAKSGAGAGAGSLGSSPASWYDNTNTVESEGYMTAEEFGSEMASPPPSGTLPVVSESRETSGAGGDGEGDKCAESAPPQQQAASSLGEETAKAEAEAEAKVAAHAKALAARAQRWARCKHCGMRVNRTVEDMESHSETCQPTVEALKRTWEGMTASVDRTASADDRNRQSDVSKAEDGEQSLGGVLRRSSLEGTDMDPSRLKGGRRPPGTRIIYRTARSASTLFRPREVCSFQDHFIDDNGTAYVYEISTRHADVRGSKGHVTAEILFLCHIAQPVRGAQGVSMLTVISQFDARGSAPSWLTKVLADKGRYGVTARFADMQMSALLGNTADDPLTEMDIAASKSGEGGGGAKVSLDDFELLAVLGRGGFGKVMQVRHMESGGVYAMKVLKKKELKRRRQVERTRTERSILAAVRHPFIVSLAFAFQNSLKLYMVMDFVQGGDFFTFLRAHGRLSEDWVRVYVAEIALALQHLHELDVVYRDLKPENVLLESDGHIKLTDFGLSRFFDTRPPLPQDFNLSHGPGGSNHQTRSFCGTEHYMAPEMLLQQGHGKGVDWWCLGLLMHEMLSGKHPFDGGSHYDTLRNMVSRDANIDVGIGPTARALLQGLLTRDQRYRLGCGSSSIDELQQQPFFAAMDWPGLLQTNRAKGPFVPTIHTEEDTRNFEAAFTNEPPKDSMVSGSQPSARGDGGGFLDFFPFNFGGSGGGGRGGESRDDGYFPDFSYVAPRPLDDADADHR